MSRLLQNYALKLLIAGVFAIASAVDATESLPNQITLDIMAKAAVTGSRVYLSDIAKCSGAEHICREISGIDVATSPAPGRTALIHKSTLNAIFAKEWPGILVSTSGVDSTRIESSSVDVALDDVKIKIQNAINQRISKWSDSLRVTIQRIQPAGAMAIRPTQSQFDFIDIDSISFENPDLITKNLVGTRIVVVRAFNPSDAEDKINLNVSMTFAVERKLPSVIRALIPGQTILDSNIAMIWIPMRRGIQDFAITEESIIGRKSRQSLMPGEPIPMRSIETPITIGRNQIVTMIVRKGDLEISARATTVDQGSVGQTVQVVNMANKLRMRAKVIDEKTVEAVAF